MYQGWGVHNDMTIGNRFLYPDQKDFHIMEIMFSLKYVNKEVL